MCFLAAFDEHRHMPFDQSLENQRQPRFVCAPTHRAPLSTIPSHRLPFLALGRNSPGLQPLWCRISDFHEGTRGFRGLGVHVSAQLRSHEQVLGIDPLPPEDRGHWRGWQGVPARHHVQRREA